MNKLILVCIVVGLIGCGKSQKEIRLEQEAQTRALEQEKLNKIEQDKIITENKIKELIKKDLRDPESATFKFQTKNYSHLYCGTVNGKNGFGGYVGDKRFIASEFGYRLDDYSSLDDFISQWFHLGFERDWVSMCEGAELKKGGSLKECEHYSNMALSASHSYINYPEIPFSELKRITLESHKNQKYISEFFDAVRKLNVNSKDKAFPMMYAIVNYKSCLSGDMSY